MIPGFFAGGEQKQEVERELINAGLEAWSTAFRERPSGATSMQTFRFVAGSRHIFCGNELYLNLAYDAGNRLQTATIRQGGACL